ncbi:UNVERIFIED_CONTAM: hypothetical protein K2H54_001615 [Gekko kuhli]
MSPMPLSPQTSYLPKDRAHFSSAPGWVPNRAAEGAVAAAPEVPFDLGCSMDPLSPSWDRLPVLRKRPLLDCWCQLLRERARDDCSSGASLFIRWVSRRKKNMLRADKESLFSPEAFVPLCLSKRKLPSVH